jgi:small subunit ribosomal protein S16
MLKIRLSRFGRHKLPIYRIVGIDSRTKRDGGYIHLLGTFNPTTKKYNLKKDLILKILNEGAQPSETVLNILKKEKI